MLAMITEGRACDGIDYYTMFINGISIRYIAVNIDIIYIPIECMEHVY